MDSFLAAMQDLKEYFGKDLTAGIMIAAVSIPISSSSYGEVVDLPAPQVGVYYIVSRLVMSACPNRQDLLVPNDLVRDEAGRVIGCRSLANN